MIYKCLSLLFVVALLTFTGGYVKGCTDAQIKIQAEKTDDVIEVIQVQDEIDTISHAITERFIEADKQREEITETVEIEVIKYVPQIQSNPSLCNLTVGTECMLNARRANHLPKAECGSLTDAEKQATSKITEAALIDADVQSSDQYAELAGRCDALIDVVDDYQKRLARMRRGSDG